MISNQADWLSRQSRKQKIFIVGIIIVALFMILAIIWRTRQYLQAVKKAITSQQSSPKTTNNHQINQKPVVLVESPINGERVEESVVNRHPLAIVIENHPDARPQRGLSDASVVYEVIAEGGITRFLAIFGPHSSVKVGPVRSARTYFVDWLLEYDGLFAHVGGSTEALQLVKTSGVKDLDQFGLGERAYKREPQTGKATEHTMFTSTDKLWDAAKNVKKYDVDSNPTKPLPWKDEEIADKRPKNQTITIQFSSEPYEVRWDYDHPSNNYKRVLAGQPQTDGNTGKQLTVKTVIIQEVTRENYTAEDGRNIWKMVTTGSGPVKVIQDGQALEGRWTKVDRTSRTRFFDADGNELKLNRGPMWIEIIPPGTPVVNANG